MRIFNNLWYALGGDKANISSKSAPLSGFTMLFHFFMDDRIHLKSSRAHHVASSCKTSSKRQFLSLEDA
jgi:hypothetical protein